MKRKINDKTPKVKPKVSKNNAMTIHVRIAMFIFFVLRYFVFSLEKSDQIAEYLARPAGFVVMLGSAISWAAGTVLMKGHVWSIGPGLFAASITVVRTSNDVPCNAQPQAMSYARFRLSSTGGLTPGGIVVPVSPDLQVFPRDALNPSPIAI